MTAKPRKERSLSERERRFVEAYMGRAAGNGTEAAKLAGYSAKAARQQASHLLTKPNIRAAISTRAESDPKVATREERQLFWSRVMVGAEQGTSWPDRLKASELLGKSQADFIERSQSLNIDLAALSDDEIAAIARGEDPLAVLARTPRRG